MLIWCLPGDLYRRTVGRAFTCQVMGDEAICGLLPQQLIKLFCLCLIFTKHYATTLVAITLCGKLAGNGEMRSGLFGLRIVHQIESDLRHLV